jgi:hypothetical protein
MRKIVIVLFFLSWGIFLTAATATAAETPLTGAGGILDQVYGLSNLMPIDDAYDQIWNPAIGNATAQAKYAAYNQDFGYILDTGEPGFGGGTFMSLFSVTGNGINLGAPSVNFDSGEVNFVWALNPSGAPLWTSLPSQNSDSLDHMMTWKIIEPDGNSAASLANNNLQKKYVIAWEDLPDGGDQDYNDLVVEVTLEGIAADTPVPIPAAILLLGSGLLALAGIRKKFKP